MAAVVQNTPSLAHGVDTTIFASKNLVKPQTVRKSYCLKGTYFGIAPTKLANGRLLWPDVIVSLHDGAIPANESLVKYNMGEVS